MPIVELSIDKHAERFLLSDGFLSLYSAMFAINSLSDNETVGALAQVAAENFVVNFAKGYRGGYGIRLVREADLRRSKGEILLTNQGFPQVDLDNNEYVNQLAIQVGSQTLDSYQFPAHTVVEESARVLASSVYKVAKKHGNVTADMIDCAMIMVHRNGGITHYERPNRGNWKKNQASF